MTNTSTFNISSTYLESTLYRNVVLDIMTYVRHPYNYLATIYIVALLSIVQVQPKENSKAVTMKSRQSDNNNINPGTLVSGSTNTAAESRPNLGSNSNSGINSHLKTLPSTSDFTSGRKPQSPEYSSSSRNKLDGRNHCESSHPNAECSDLDGECLECNFDAVKNTCIYGKSVTVTCNATVTCKGRSIDFQKEIICQYCYQTPQWQQVCHGSSQCNSVGVPRYYFKTNCTVAPEVLCLGNRRFSRMMPCNWKNGYRWSTTLFLSITLGGFGADRFYLGRWQEGIGKLFSFGGLGLWTFVDIVLIGVRYLGPADGSLYVD